MSGNKKSVKSKKTTCGDNLTPLISALLLAGIKLALDKKKKSKASATTIKAKTVSASRLRKTI